MSMMFRLKYGQSLDRVLFSDIHQGWLNEAVEDDEDQHQPWRGWRGQHWQSSWKKVWLKGRKNVSAILCVSILQFNIYTIHVKRSFHRKVLFWMNGFCTKKKDYFYACNPFKHPVPSPWQYTTYGNITFRYPYNSLTCKREDLGR